MTKSEKVSLILIGIGLLLMAIAYQDFISITAEFCNKLWHLNLPVITFNSFWFRSLITLIGGTFSAIGGLILKKERKNGI